MCLAEKKPACDTTVRVVLVTSGPGCSNLVTGLATANSEGDPLVVIGIPVDYRDNHLLVDMVHPHVLN